MDNGLVDQSIVQAVFPMDMGSKWAGLLESRQPMWWIVALLGQECISWQSKCTLVSGQGGVMPGGSWDCLNILCNHVKSVDSDVARVEAWVHQEVVELLPEIACAVAAGK
jgi:hypothetical protein